MNIVIFGAGAIGSLFGGMLSQNNNVVLVGRKKHVDTINKKGLTLQDNTNLNLKISAFENIKDVSLLPDLIIITVKSYDTEKAIKQAKLLMGDKTFVMSLQNGLDNIKKINKHVKKEKIIVGITTHGAVFSKPGIVKHTGIGSTIIGGLSEDNKIFINKIAQLFNNSNIKTTINIDIQKEIWIKGIVNSSINPITAFFNCKNGYLLKNQILKNLVEKICKESTNIVNTTGAAISYEEMIKKTESVILDTSENFSSMLQSVKQGKKTEIDSINGVLVGIGNEHKISTLINKILIYSIKSF